MTIIAWKGWVDDSGGQEDDDSDDSRVATAQARGLGHGYKARLNRRSRSWLVWGKLVRIGRC